MAFAEETDVVKALRRELTSGEQEYVTDVIAEAQDLIVGYLGCDPTDEDNDPAVPAAVTRVTARMVARVFKQDDGRPVGSTQRQQGAGPYTSNLTYVPGSTSGSPWLASSDKVILRPYRCGGGMRSVAFKSERDYDYLPVDET